MGEFYYLGNARTQAQHDEMVALEADKLCLFCPEGVAARGKSIIWENDFWIVTDNDYPYPHTLHHLMLLPKRHMTDMTELSSQEWSAMSDAIGYAKAEFEFHSYGLASRNGEPSLTGGTIRHLHIHIVVGDPSSSEPVRVKLSSQPK